MDQEKFDKFVINRIKESVETLEFLKGQALEIFEESREYWENKQNEEEKKDAEFWCEYLNVAKNKFEKYLPDWLENIALEIPFCIAEQSIPSPLVSIFRDSIFALVYEMDYQEISDIILEEIFENHLKKMGKVIQ